MVARTPPKLQQRKMVAPLNPILLRETLNKVDKCMARLQELQYTVTGGSKVISGVTLSPRSTRGYLRTSLRCKQESLRIKSATSNRSPHGKLPTNIGEWKRMSLPAMLLGETVNEILQASQFAKKIVEAASDDPKTPITIRQNKKKPSPENSELRARRKREKLQTGGRFESYAGTPSLQRAKSRINFKVSPVHKRECDNENCKYIANRVSPRHRPWARKTVLFPNPLFHNTSEVSNGRRASPKPGPSPTRLARPGPKKTTTAPHKFLIKSPVKIRSPPPLCIISSPTRAAAKKSPNMMSKMRRSLSPSRLANRIVSSSPSKMMRRSFSPSRLANKIVSPLKTRKQPVVQNADAMKMMMSGLKQRPSSSSLPMQFPARRL